MKVSIALCTYNGAEYIRDQLESISAQSRPPDELVVIDDCSTDGTVQIVRDFAARSSFPIRLEVSQQNLGFVKNFEKAISLCTGEIIALCDQDDHWMPDKLQVIESTFRKDKTIGLVFSDAEVVDKDLKPLGYRLWDTKFPEIQRNVFLHGHTLDILLYAATVTGATMAFRAELIPALLPIPELRWVAHDGWIALVGSSISQIALIDQPLIKYRLHPGQQIGVRGNPDWTPPTRWIVPLDEGATFERLKLVKLLERLSGPGRRFDCGSAISEISQRLRHLDVRTNLPKNLLKRTPRLVGELVTMRYHRHSNGLRSFLKDVFLVEGSRSISSGASDD